MCVEFKTGDKLKAGEPITIKGDLSISEIDALFKRKTKIWVIGKYKSGKSTLIEKMCKTHGLSHPTRNTKGEMMIIDDCIYIDTEGFNQPLSNEDPYFKKDLIIEHLNESCDQLIFVVNRVDSHDASLLQELYDVYLNSQSIKSFIVVHNVSNVKKSSELSEHVGNVCSALGLEKQDEFRATIQLSQFKQAIHIFFGMDFIGFNVDSINKVEGPMSVSLTDSLSKSLIATINKYYNVVDSSSPERSNSHGLARDAILRNVRTTINPQGLLVSFQGELRILVNKHVVNVPTIKTYWAYKVPNAKYDPNIKGSTKEWDVCLIVPCASFDFLKIEALDTTSVLLSGVIYDYVGSKIPFTKIVRCPVPLIVKTHNMLNTVIQKYFDGYGSLFLPFEFSVNYSPDQGLVEKFKTYNTEEKVESEANSGYQLFSHESDNPFD
jgi:GTPase Era involved in 16S rRNA processing